VTVSAKTNPEKSLQLIVVPGVDRALADVGRAKAVSVADGTASVQIELGFPAAGLVGELESLVREVLRDECDAERIEVEFTTKIAAHGVQRNLKPIANVRNVVAIASGKGGVGKSTTAVNLALALSGEGANVGVLDADIYGPSIPLMLGVDGERPTSDDGQSMNPLQAHGLQVMSIGFLVDPDQPMVWRGPMVTQALNQMLQQTRWSDLDYLIVDMPPGTGDIQLTLSQQVPVSGAVIVTTPQDIALLDARKGLQMFRKVNVPVLGVIENMSTHVCTNCGHEAPLFGSGGGAKMAEEYDIELLGQLPLDLRIRQQTDDGQPSVIAEPEEGPADAYRKTARRMAARLATQGKDYSAKFPKIIVEET
jgi:ATP-binding protein involved in chromosome partitioning